MKISHLATSPKGIESYKIENASGAYVVVITFGARIASLCVNDRDGKLVDVVAGFENVDDFMGENPYFNAVVGRVCNRIGGAKFELDGNEYNLFKNDGNNHLHGGKVGFDSRLWTAQIVDGKGVKMSRLSPSGEEGYPANLNVSVTYSLSDDNALSIEYEASADGDTLCSLTNHAYFNLDGDFKTVLGHKVFIDADFVTAVDDELIPHGERKNILGTAFDFTKEKTIGRDINEDEHMLKIARGYDFNYVLRGEGYRKVATAKGEKSGVKMSVFTDRPCMQLYTGNFLEGLKGKKIYGYQSAFCMETQGFPNACNVPSFESIILKKGETYTARTTYKFDVE